LRKKAVTVDMNLESRALTDRILSEIMGKGVRCILVNDRDSLLRQGIVIQKELPDAVTAITPQILAEALVKHDPIKKVRPVVAEECILKCPLSG
jgi:hypothetical protein